MGRFRAKKSKKRKSYIVIILIFIITFLTTAYLLLSNLSINLDNKQIISYIINPNSKTLEFEKLNDPKFVLNYTFGNEFFYEEDNSLPVINVVEKSDANPQIYIYNSHPTEKFSYEEFEVFNITPTIVTASYILNEYLHDHNINSIVETDSSATILNENDWSYSYSYIASRILLEKAQINYPSLEYFFDLHRDSASKEITTTIINDQSCARFLFVVGLEHENYEKNLALTEKINDKLNEINPKFTRGISKKEGEGVNGIYNQDFHPNTILIEVGGHYNTIDEVNCSLVYLSEVIKEVVNGN